MRVCVDIPETLMNSVMDLIKKGYFKNKSELVRYAVRRLVEEYK